MGVCSAQTTNTSRLTSNSGTIRCRTSGQRRGGREAPLRRKSPRFGCVGVCSLAELVRSHFSRRLPDLIASARFATHAALWSAAFCLLPVVHSSQVVVQCSVVPDRAWGAYLGVLEHDDTHTVRFLREKIVLCWPRGMRCSTALHRAVHVCVWWWWWVGWGGGLYR